MVLEGGKFYLQIPKEVNKCALLKKEFKIFTAKLSCDERQFFLQSRIENPVKYLRWIVLIRKHVMVM